EVLASAKIQIFIGVGGRKIGGADACQLDSGEIGGDNFAAMCILYASDDLGVNLLDAPVLKESNKDMLQKQQHHV
ncbi:unnamed protein product, partial [Urochloa humidicola]